MLFISALASLATLGQAKPVSGNVKLVLRRPHQHSRAQTIERERERERVNSEWLFKQIKLIV